MTDKSHSSHEGGGGNYWRFMAMLATSTAIGLVVSGQVGDHVFPDVFEHL